MMLHELNVSDMQTLKAEEVDYWNDMHPFMSTKKRLVCVNSGGGWYCKPMKQYPNAPGIVKLIRVFVGINKARYDSEWDQQVTETTCVLNLPWKDGLDEYRSMAPVGEKVSIYFCFANGHFRDWKNFYYGDMVIDFVEETRSVFKVHFVKSDYYVDKQQLKRENDELRNRCDNLRRAGISKDKFHRARYNEAMKARYSTSEGTSYGN